MLPVPTDQPQRWTPLPTSWRDTALKHQGTVLLESSLPSPSQRHSYLFTDAQRILTADAPGDLAPLFNEIEQALAGGHWVAGYLTYEAGSHFVDLPSQATQEPLAVFGIYDAPRIFNHVREASAEPTVPPSAPLPIAPMLRIRRDDYTSAIARIQGWIAAGATYQLNFTTHAASPYEGGAETIYDALKAQQPCSYGGILQLLPGRTILSFSPELFFRAAPDGTLTTKPMKGTAVRGVGAEEDDLLADALRADEKNRAEHVMIVDLLRNDLGRVCEAGSVDVDRLFDVERYPTLLQMTSTITGRMPPHKPWYQVFQALFPSGSITGAPKRHTMELITQVEAGPRGVYTGAIGYFAPDRSACFNVAIRTVVLDGHTMELGVGGGIVADSTAEGEYDECLLKTSFLHRAAQPIDLIETMRWSSTDPDAPRTATALDVPPTATEPGDPFLRSKDGLFAQNANQHKPPAPGADSQRISQNIPLLLSHLQRLESSAASLGFRFNTQSILEAITKAAATWNGQPKRIRLLLHCDGTTEIQHAEAPCWPSQMNVTLSSRSVLGEAPHLRHKTTFRPEYEPAFREAVAAGYDEALFQNDQGEITEGCISSLLVCKHGRWYTPPLRSGCLPGIYRAELLRAGLLQERVITLDDLREAEHVCLCNAVRGAGCVASLQLPRGERIRYKIATKPPQLPAW